jgi:RNA ligase (TIGR02306 family)
MKLASIETITALKPHANADRLELAQVLGWQTIVKKGDFKAGDRCVFVVIDTILPKAPWSDFLASKSSPDAAIRLRTAKLRGEYSQGLALPLTVLAEHLQSWQDGADVGGELGVKKYEKEIPAVLSGICKSTFPSHYAPKTDEDNGLSNLDIVEFVSKEDPLIATIKLDGSSCTIVIEDGSILEVCSRNMSLIEDEKNGFWRAARKLNLKEFPYSGRWVLQGELMGPGVQGNQLGLSEPTFHMFQLRGEGLWQTQDCLEIVAGLIGCPYAWVVRRYDEAPLIGDFQRLADETKLPNGKPAEGIVVRPTIAIAFGNGRPAGFKIINRNYGE